MAENKQLINLFNEAYEQDNDATNRILYFIEKNIEFYKNVVNLRELFNYMYSYESFRYFDEVNNKIFALLVSNLGYVFVHYQAMKDNFPDANNPLPFEVWAQKTHNFDYKNLNKKIFG
jgi:hypothetical protein